jgi:hypothetical protein
MTGECLSDIIQGQVINYVTQNSASGWIETATTAASGAQITGIQMNGWIFNQLVSSPTASYTSQPTSTSSDSSNNTSRNIGIGVGVPLAAIGVIALGVAFWYIKRQQRKLSTIAAYREDAVDPQQSFPASKVKG